MVCFYHVGLLSSSNNIFLVLSYFSGPSTAAKNDVGYLAKTRFCGPFEIETVQTLSSSVKTLFYQNMPHFIL